MNKLGNQTFHKIIFSFTAKQARSPHLAAIDLTFNGQGTNKKIIIINNNLLNNHAYKCLTFIKYT